MRHFLRQPASRPIGDEPDEQRVRQLVEAWACTWVWQGIYRTLEVPVGYIWDGMSIPRWAISLAGIYTGGMGDAASLPHDALYRAAGGAKPEGWSGCRLNTFGTPITRKEADAVLALLMRSAGFSRYRSGLARTAVRIGGRKHWGGPSPYGEAS